MRVYGDYRLSTDSFSKNQLGPIGPSPSRVGLFVSLNGCLVLHLFRLCQDLSAPDGYDGYAVGAVQVPRTHGGVAASVIGRQVHAVVGYQSAGVPAQNSLMRRAFVSSGFFGVYPFSSGICERVFCVYVSGSASTELP